MGTISKLDGIAIASIAKVGGKAIDDVASIGGETPPPSYANVNSFDFDGVDESFASAIPGSFFSKSNPWSVSCWVQCDVRTSTKGIFGNTSNASGIRLRSANSGAPVFGIEFQFHMVGTGTWAGYQLGVISADYAWSNTTWYHIVVTYDGSSTGAGLKMYVNNNLTTSGSPDFTTSDSVSSYDFAIGAIRHSPFSNGHDGRIDELAVWNSELSSSNVAAIYNSGTPDSLTSLSPSYWYRMGEKATFSNPGGSGDWTMVDQGSVGTNALSANMEEADRTTDTP